MISPDVNVLVRAWWADVPEHEKVRHWLERAVGDRQLVLTDVALSGAVRVLTHPRVTGSRFTNARILKLADDLRSADGVCTITPGLAHWDLFKRIVVETGSMGNRVPDCYYAALAIEHGLTWATSDRFFAQVEGLDWVDPLRDD